MNSIIWFITIYLIIGFAILLFDTKFIKNNFVSHYDGMNLKKIELIFAKAMVVYSWPFWILFRIFRTN